MADRYRLVERIARGGMGFIYEAVHTTTGRRFAVKMLLPGLGNVTEIARRFEREARAASSLSHPNIVSVVDFGALDDGTMFLAMELVNGRALADILDEQRIEPARAFVICRQLLEGLAHAHAHGVIHRDLKPDNIMLVDAGASDEERDIVKIVDFGIAKWAGEQGGEAGDDRLTQAGVAFGTPTYMSPEQALGEEVDARADLYAAGIILYELLAGKPPFDSHDKVAVLRMQVAVSLPPLEGEFAPELGDFLQRALAKRREQRFAGADEMLAALEVAAAAQAARDAPPPPVLVAESGADVATTPVALADATPGARRLSRDVLYGLGAAAAILLLVIGVTSGGRPAAPPLPRRAAAPLTPPPSALAVSEAAGQRAAGLAYAQSGRDADALRAYGLALARAPGVTDDGMRAALAAMLGRKGAALATVELLPAAGNDGRSLLVDQAARGKIYAARVRARELAEAAGWGGDVDLLASLGLDLAQAPSCRERREAVLRLRALGDKRAIPMLKRARGRSGGFLGLEAVNGCLDRDAAEAIEFLQALP